MDFFLTDYNVIVDGLTKHILKFDADLMVNLLTVQTPKM